MIHLLRRPATPRQIQEMLEDHGVAIKVVVDVEEEVMSGGGIYHRDGEGLLLTDGSMQSNLWGATWYADGRILFESFINIRPADGNRGIDVQSPRIRNRIEAILRRFLEGKP